jgi:hypothetical protein
MNLEAIEVGEFCNTSDTSINCYQKEDHFLHGRNLAVTAAAGNGDDADTKNDLVVTDPPAMHADDRAHQPGTFASAGTTATTTDDSPIVLRKWQQWYGWFMSDVLLYIVVLNLASELVQNIHINRFSISLFVAVVLKLVLSAIQSFEHYIKHLCCDVWNRKILGGFVMWLIIFSSKFLLLWIDDVIFGSQVDLGYFWEILILSFTLIIASLTSRMLFQQLGRWDSYNTEGTPRNANIELSNNRS